MKKFLILLLLVTMVLTSEAYAMHNGKATGTVEGAGYAHQECNSADVKVNGLVCDFCARALEKVFGKKEEVSGIKVDLDKGDVVINFKAGKNLPDAELKDLISNSGYDVTKIARNECK